MKKVVSLALAIVIALSLCACSSSANKLVGNWVCEESCSGYPDQMTLYEDGTGVLEGVGCSWTAENGVLTILVGYLGTWTYEYEIDGAVLYLDGYYAYH